MQHKAEAEGLNFVKDFATLEESKFYIINPSLIKQQKPIQKPKMYVRIRHTAVSVIIKNSTKISVCSFCIWGQDEGSDESCCSTLTTIVYWE